MSFGAYSQTPGDSASYAHGDSARFAIDELRDIAVLLQQRLSADEELRLKNQAIARLGAAHNTLVTSYRLCTEELPNVRLALKESTAETEAVTYIAAKDMRIGKLRFKLAILGGAVATFSAFQIGRSWK